ncbi:MAG: hypothetical protein QM703_10440 [Gemmatales bacterium]
MLHPDTGSTPGSRFARGTRRLRGAGPALRYPWQVEPLPLGRLWGDVEQLYPATRLIERHTTDYALGRPELVHRGVGEVGDPVDLD